jgi:hypothetical protein
MRLDATWVHVAFVALVSIAFEAQFIHHSINLMDEGWPLHAAMGLHEGGSLYREVFWVFPPGHLLAAWIGYGVGPPGVVVSRIIYAGFTVALVVASYFLGRRIMPARYAVFGALLLALCGTSAHRLQLLFGFRYLVFAVLALLAFARRIDTGDRRWSLLAGVATGVALLFRLTPAFAVSVGIGAAIVASDRSWRSWLRDGFAYSAGVLVIVVPCIAWFAYSVGLETLWREAVVRPVVMTDLQNLPLPRLLWLPATLERRRVMRWFVAWQYRLYLLLYAGYTLAVLWVWFRAWRDKHAGPSPVFVGLVVFGAVYFVRTLGRSDAAHLYSAIPPVCLLLGHALWKGLSRFEWPARRELGAIAACLGLWIYLMGSEVFLLDPAARGLYPLASLGGRVHVNTDEFAKQIDVAVAGVRSRSRPGDTILVMGQVPLFYPLTGRSGPGHADVVIPGTFATSRDESAFVERLEKNPPALVVWSGAPFDHDPNRHARRASPILSNWVRRHYRKSGIGDDYKVLVRLTDVREAVRKQSQSRKRRRAGPKPKKDEPPPDHSR